MKDKCVSCRTKTLYDKEEHVDFRIGYIEGAGQLCLDCFSKIYGHKQKNVTKDEHRYSRKSS